MKISAQKRKEKGAKVKKLRKESLLPGIIFSKRSSRGESETIPVTVNLTEFKKVYAEAGESTLITIELEKETPHDVLISEVQHDPIALDPIHVGFYEVDLTEKITANIPIEVTGEEKCAPIKNGEGILITLMDSVEVECLPKDLPQKFEVDISDLQNVDDVITVQQGIKVDKDKVEIKEAPEDILLKIDYAEQLEEEEEEMAVEDVEVTTGQETEEKQESEEDKEEGTKDKPGQTSASPNEKKQSA